MTDQIQDLLARVPQGKAAGRGKYLEALDEETREVVRDFAKWLVESDGKASSTASAYQGYVARFIAEPATEWEALTTDARSAVNAFMRYSKAASEDAAE